MAFSSERLLRPNLRSYSAYKPGTSAEEVKRRFGFERVVKLSQNENPLGTSPLALAAVRGIDTLSDYVEDDHRTLRTRLALPYALEVDHVILGHGSNELVQLVFLAFVDPGDDVVIARPTFSLFRKYAEVAAANAIAVPVRADGVHDLPGMLAALTPRTKAVFVCDPNNPTGTRVERADLSAFARALPPDVLLVLDQAYFEYMDAGGADGVDIMRVRPSTLVLRTSSKIHGLASVRFGYGYSSPEIIAYLNRVRLPFNVGRPAAVAMLAALDDRDFCDRSKRLNAEGKAQFEEAFERLGLHAYRSAANFVAVAVPVGADEAYGALLERGIIVRSGDGLGMPGRLRVTIGSYEDNVAFIAALEALLPLWQTPLEAVH